MSTKQAASRHADRLIWPSPASSGKIAANQREFWRATVKFLSRLVLTGGCLSPQPNWSVKLTFTSFAYARGLPGALGLFMKVTANSIEAAEIAELTRFAEGVYQLIPKSSSAAPMITVLDEALYEWQQSSKKPLEEFAQEEIIFALGILWGNIVVEKHQWRWTDLTFHDFGDWSGRAVVSQNGSLLILPFAHIHECLSGRDEVKISASFAALSSSIIPDFPPASYENVTHGIQRIVPRG